MGSYLTPAEENSFRNEFNNLHDTYARPIVIFQTAKGVVVATNPQHNYLFDSAPTNSIEQEIVVSGAFNARILYGKRQLLTNFGSVARNGAADQVGPRMDEGDVRLKLDPTGAAFMGGVQRVTFDGNLFDVITTPRPHSLIGTPNFYDFFLKKIN